VLLFFKGFLNHGIKTLSVCSLLVWSE
jgi:hypothetical protein